MLNLFDVFGPSLVGECCRSVECFAVTCCFESVSVVASSSTILLFASSKYHESDKVPCPF